MLDWLGNEGLPWDLLEFISVRDCADDPIENLFDLVGLIWNCSLCTDTS